MGYLMIFIPHIIFIIWMLVILIAHLWLKINKQIAQPDKYFKSFIEKSYKERTLIDNVSYFYFEIYKFISFVLFVGVLVYSLGNVLKQLNEKSVFLILQNIQKNLPDDLLTWFGIVITIATVVATYKKEYYLVFSAREVLSSYNFERKIVDFIIIIVMMKLCNIVLSLVYIDNLDIYIFTLNCIYFLLYVWGGF